MIFQSKNNKLSGKENSRRPQNTQWDAGVCFEPLEPRLLLSGSWGAGSEAPSQETKPTSTNGLGQETIAMHDDAGISGMIAQQQQGMRVAGRIDLLAKATALNTAEADQDADAPASSIQNKTAADPSRLSDQQSSTAVEVSNEIIFVDTGIHNYADLVDDLLANKDGDREFEVILLETGRDGIDQISDTLALRQQVDAVHFVTHGNDRAIKLGGTWLSSDIVEAYANDISGWQNALTPEADLLFYGCELAAGSDGQMLLETMGSLTGADVAASDDLTGSSRIGGDWHLEYGRGAIETNIAFSREAQAQWDSVLTAFTVDTTADTADANPGDGIAEDASGNTSLRAAIEESNALGGADEITLNPGAYTLSGGELEITADLTITGSDPRTTLIDGDGADRVFKIDGNSNVTMTGITVMNGDANNSGGLFVERDSTLYLSDAIVRDNNSNMGGGVHVHGTAHLERVLLNNNTADKGGGIHFHGADGGSLTNVTISGNTVTDEGGGLWTDSSITITNTTIADNTASSQGGGLYRSSGTVDIGNSIVADNTAPLGDDVIGFLSSDGSNLFEDPLGGFGFHPSDALYVADPLLALADNGGTMMTHVPTAAEAIDGGDRGLMSITDQRGFLRGDGNPDIGAYEVGASADSTADYLDRFDAVAFNGDDGALPWSNDWQEIGDFSDGPNSGDIIVMSHLGEQALRIDEDAYGVWRQADLSGASSATLSFDYVRSNMDVGDTIVLEISTDGSSWDELRRYDGPADDTSWQTYSEDISAYIDSDTRIRFTVVSMLHGNDHFYIDNVRINLTGAVSINNAPTATNLSSTSAYNEGDATVAITNIVVSDADAGETVTATLTLDNTATGSLSANDGAIYTAGTGVWTITDTVANVNLALSNLVFTPNTDNDVDTTIDVVIDDGDEDAGGPLTGTITLDVTPANDVPVLDASGNMVLTNVIQDNSNPPGNSVANIISSAGGDRISDADTGALEGIAVIGVDNADGTWEYSTNGGSTWASFIAQGVSNGSTDETAAVLLADDALIRFVPTAAYTGPAGDITFRAWDRTAGASGDVGVNLAVAVPTAVSVASETATLNVIAGGGVSNLVPSAQNVDEEGSLTFSTAGGNSVQIDDGNSGDTLLETTLTVTNGTLTLASITGLTFVAGANGTASMTVSGSESAINNALDGMAFSPTSDYNGPANLQVSTTLSDSGMLGFYTFDNGGDPGNDDGPLGTNDGSLLGGVSSVFDATRGDNILEFDGIDSAVRIPGKLGQPADLTFAAWVNVDTGLQDYEAISIGNNVVLRIDEVAGGNGVNGIFWDGSSYQNLSSGNFLNGTGWHHVAFTFDDTNNLQALYIDGVGITSGFTQSISYNQGTDTYLGRNGAGASYFLDGRLDDVRIYDRALSDGEITALFNEQTSAVSNVTIAVNPVNDAPTATNLTSTSIYNEGDGPVAITDIVVSDVDTGETITATLTLANTSAGSLSADNGASYASGTGVWTITDTVANVNLALANLEFSPNTDNDVDTTIDVVIDDGDEDAGGPLTGTITLDVTPANDAPTATNLTTASAYNEGIPNVSITDIVVSDADTGDTITATLTLTDTSTGRLNANNGASYDGGTGVWTITDTVSNVNVALANLLFLPNTDNDVDTTIDVVIDDGDEDTSGPLTGTITLDVTPVNDAPAVSGTYIMTGTNEDTTSAAVQVSTLLADASITANDPDGDTLGIAVFAKIGLGSWQYSTNGVSGWTDFGSVNPNAAVLLSETAWVRYVPDGVNAETAGFDFRGWDQSADFSSINGTPRFGDTVPGGGGTGAYSIGSASVSLTVSSVNDAPKVNLNNILTAISDDVDTSSAIKVADIVITDDAMGTNTLSLGGADAGMFEIVGANALYLKAGSFLDYSANPTLDVTVFVDDTGVGGTPDDGAALSITVNHANLPPTATHLNSGENYTEDVPLNLKDIVVTDVDSATVTVTLTLADPAAGSLSTGTSGTITSTYAGGVWTASGAIADVNALLAGVVFTPTANYDGTFTMTAGVDDGLAAPVTGVKVITGTAVGDTPHAGSTTTLASTQSGLIAINRNPDDGAEVTHFHISGITNGTLFLADGTTEINNGDFVTIAQGQAGLRFSPVVNTYVNGSFIVESSEDGVTVALQSGGALSVVSVIPPTSPTEGSTPEDTGDTAFTEPEVELAPEDPEAEVEPEVNPEEELPGAIIAPAKPVHAAKPSLPGGGAGNAGSSFLIQVGDLFGDILGTGDNENKSDERQANTTAARSERIVEDPGPGLADRIARAYNRIAAHAYLNMLNTLDEVKEERDEDIAFNQTVLGSAIVMSTSLSVGYVVWMIRGGMLLSSLLSSIPAWQILDPLPVLARKNKDDDDDDESLESILDRKPQGDAAKKKNTPGKSQMLRRRSDDK